MNQPSSSAAQATHFPKPPSRLFRYRSAVYSIVAISIAGAASAPLFVVQRASAQDKQGRQQPLQSPGQPTQVALAVAQLADADPLAHVSQESISALTNSARMPAASVAQKRALPIRHDVAGSAFKPLRVAAWLPDPASYVARNSDADGNAPLPATAIERTPDLKPGPVGRASDKAVEPASERAPEGAAESRTEAVASKPVLSEARRASFAPQAIPRLQDMVSLAPPNPSASEPLSSPLAAGKSAGQTRVEAASAKLAKSASRAMKLASTQSLPQASKEQAEPSAQVISASSNSKRESGAAHALAGDRAQQKEKAVAARVASSAMQAAEEESATIVVAAARTDESRAMAAAAQDHLAFHLQAGQAPAAKSKLGAIASKPFQASAAVDEEVVIVAAASAPKLDAPIERVAAKAANADVVVVSTAPAETVNLDVELRGLSLAMATRLNAPQSSLARGPELPNWAVMGEGKKLRVAR